MTQQHLFHDSYIDFCQSILDDTKFQNEYRLFYKIGVLYDLWKIADQDTKNEVRKSLDWAVLLLEEKKYRWSLNRLLESAFIFANLAAVPLDNKLEEEIKNIDCFKNKAYRIAISIYYYGKYLEEEKIESNFWFDNYGIIYQLFTRLWILSKARDEKLDNVTIGQLNLHGKIESVARELKNRFCISDELALSQKFENDMVYFSDFQNEIVNKLRYKFATTSNWSQIRESLAISAPTSAGKTYVIKKYLVFRILEHKKTGNNINIAFVVPSKALINELLGDFIDLFKEYNLEGFCNIHTYIAGDEFLENYSKKSNLFLFTQERLNYFLNNINNQIVLDILVVDEAHKVWFWYRWTLLSYVVNKLKKNTPSIQIILLAPLLSKLYKFKKEFWLNSLTESFSNFSPVAKNLIEINHEKSKEGNIPYVLKFSIKIEWKKEKLFTLGFNPERDTDEQKIKQEDILTFASKTFTSWKNVQSIIFRYAPDKTKEQAELLTKASTQSTYISASLENYIWDILPLDFPLIEYLKNWIAYHNWGLPISIKTQIEKEFKEKNIKFLCANYTVLEGVNLPAKNIFIGWADINRNNIPSLDLKNLIGRSGRLNEHLSWNVFFVNFKNIPDDDNVHEIMQNNVSVVLDDTTDTEIAGKTKFDRFLHYISHPDAYKATISRGYWNNLDEERKDFEYMTWYLLSKHFDEILIGWSNSANKLVPISEILPRSSEIFRIKNEVPLLDYIKKIGEFLYESWEQKDEKLIKLQSALQRIYSDINIHTSLSRIENWEEVDSIDVDFFNLIKRNIFVDPRKQLDFYVQVENGTDLFVKENIQALSDIIKLLTNREELRRESIRVGDVEFEKIITKKMDFLKWLINEVQKYFVQKYQSEITSESGAISSSRTILYYAWDRPWMCENYMVDQIISWISSVPIKKMLWIRKEYYFDNLKTITNDIQFTYLNAVSIYFDIANLGYRRFMENHGDQSDEILSLDMNFPFYLELWTFWPNMVYLISNGVSRESAIWLNKNSYITIFPPIGMWSKDYFQHIGDKLQKDLLNTKKILILEELRRFIYT